MSDTANQLAQALRDLINEAVQQSVQEAVARRPAPRDTPTSGARRRAIWSMMRSGGNTRRGLENPRLRSGASGG